MSAVIDASTAILGALADSESGAVSARRILSHLHERYGFRAPMLLAWEVGNVVHRKHWSAFGQSHDARAHVVATILSEITLVSHDAAAGRRTGEIAEGQRLSFYDAAYLELATRDAASVLLTEDRRLRAAASSVLGPDRAHNAESAARAVEQGRL